MDRNAYNEAIEALFRRHPSVQRSGFSDAYKPGLAHQREMDARLGNPSRAWRSVHVAGTNGKGSVANLIAAALAASGLRVGLYTSPHLLDFRERMRVAGPGPGQAACISREAVWDFLQRHGEHIDALGLSFFEITTAMAFDWFAREKVDVAVLEAGLGGRLDSTNIVTPLLSVITSIGLDHCEWLGSTRAAIAAEKAGIIKSGVPALIGEMDDETAPVFRAKAAEEGAPLFFAPLETPPLWERHRELLSRMDLQGECQRDNLRTVLSALELLRPALPRLAATPADTLAEALEHTASRMDFHGRWERLQEDPLVLCDIGHNAAALRRNFAQLDALARQRGTRPVIVYGVMADKDLDAILPLLPADADYRLCAPGTARALPADKLLARFLAGRPEIAATAFPSVRDAVSDAVKTAAGRPQGLVYIGGSTFVVAEAVPWFDGTQIHTI